MLLLGWGEVPAQVGNNLILLSNWDNPNLPAVSNLVYNEVWGWEDGNGREYAIMGSMQWTYFIEVTNPSAPVVRDSVQGTHGQCIHRDFKTYGQYCYGVADEGNSTLQIMDMSYLPDSVHVVYNSDNFFKRAHNIFIDTTAGRLYAVGTNTQNGGAIILNLAANPANPPLLASVNLNSYTHDLYVRNDTAYMNNGYDGLRIVDFTVPTSPVLIGSLPSYPQQGYNHSSWLTEDGDYLAMCDETRNKSSKMVDVRNLGNIGITSMFRSALLYPDTTSIPHNPLIAGNYLCISHYHDGVQIWDISNPAAPLHVAGYDTYPLNTTYNDWYGAWGVYPFLPSGTVLASDVLNGLFVFRVPFPFPHPLTASSVTGPATCSYTPNGSATVVVNGGTAPYTYLWSSGHTTPSVATLLPGTYTVTVTDRHGYFLVDTVTVPGPAPLQVNAQVAAETCDGTADGEINLITTGGTPGYSYLWSTGDMVEDLNGLTAGTYSVTVTDSAGCLHLDTISLSFLQPAPPAFAGHDTVLCTSALLLAAQTPTQGLGHWEWVSGSGNLQNPNAASTWATNLHQGSNLLAWVVQDGQCSNVDTLAIVVSSVAWMDAGPDTVICGSILQLDASPAGTGQGLWSAQPSTVAFNSFTLPTATASGLQPGVYQLYWTITDGNCQGTDSLTVWVSRPPFAVFTYSPSGLSVNFQDLSQYATQWEWDFGDGNTSTVQHPSHTYAQPGLYTVCLVAEDTCGSATTCQSIFLNPTGYAGSLPGQVLPWPNPFGEWLGVTVAGAGDGMLNGRLLDLHGRSCWQGSHLLQGGAAELRLELPGLAAGVYLLELRTEQWTRMVKVVHNN